MYYGNDAMQGPAADIICFCYGSMLGVSAVGRYLNRWTPSAWRWQEAVTLLKSCMLLADPVDGTVSDYDKAAELHVMGVIELSVRTLPTERRDAFLALEVFRRNVLIPAPIVALAFEAYTCKSYDLVLLRHMLLAVVDARVLVHDESRDCYKVLDLVAECLERTTIYPAHIGQGQRPSSTMLSARGKASSEAPSTSLERRELLAAFLISFG